MFKKKKDLYIQEIRPVTPRTPEAERIKAKKIEEKTFIAKRSLLKKREPKAAFQIPHTYNTIKSSFRDINRKNKDSGVSVIVPFMNYNQICSM